MSDQQEKTTNRQHKISKIQDIVIVLLILLLISIFFGFFYTHTLKILRRNVIYEVTLESGNPILLEYFFTEDATNTKFVTDISSIDTRIPQTYELKVRTGKYFIKTVEKVILNIVDTTAPTATAVPQLIYTDTIPEAIDTLTDIYDVSPVTAEYVIPMGEETEAGERDISVRLSDSCGNETIIDVPFTIIYDPVAPVITGATDISVFIGDPILYREGVTVTDNYDPNPSLTIDTSAVNTSEEGVYPVTYTATDDHGNETSVTVNLTLRIKPERYYDPDEIYALAKDVIERYNICNEDMSDEQITLRILDWISQRMWYVRGYDRYDWTVGAYDGLTTISGDCYNYMAVAHAMFGAMGIESVWVERYPHTDSSTHFWNIVNIDGLWYHCDASLTPTMDTPYNFICLYTDREISWWNYSYNPDDLPEGAVMATESIQYRLNYSGVPERVLPPEEPEEPEELEEPEIVEVI